MEFLEELEEIGRIFEELYIVNLSITTQDTGLKLRSSTIRKKIRWFRDISLNFVAYLDNIFTVNYKLLPTIGGLEGITTLLTSLPTFYEFEISYD